jgi:S-adenosylmethionine:tRNA ribosyltransferase-isomerase
MVFNNTKVIQARMHFRKSTGALIEIFLLEPAEPTDYELMFQTSEKCAWYCLVGNLKKWKEGTLTREIEIKGQPVVVTATRGPVHGTSHRIGFEWTGGFSFAEIIDAMGELPIPPYLNRKAEESDSVDYQTVYSHYKGSVAAPTAGLHFSPELLKSLKTKIDELTLHVGAGTFKPVKTETIGEHEMHREFFAVNKDVIEDLIKYQGKITAVGTTSVRTLESLYWIGVKLATSETCTHLSQWECYQMQSDLSLKDSLSNILKVMERNGSTVYKASTGIMIAPGYRYKVVNNIITNFHQPESTLLLLVSAAVGNAWKDIYNYALDNDFRFLSYGDGCFLEVD